MIEEKRWYCVSTKYHKEGDIQFALKQLEIETLNPRIKIRKIISKKYQWIEEALFPCYLFAKFDYLKFYNLIRYTRGVKKIVTFGTEPARCPEEMISTIKSNLVDNCIVVDKLNKFKAGEKVSVIDGPFAGLVGIFNKETSATERVYILLEILGKEIRVEIDKLNLKAVNE